MKIIEDNKISFMEVKIMVMDQREELEYVPPNIEIFEITEIMNKLGPVLSCSGFGGSSSGC